MFRRTFSSGIGKIDGCARGAVIDVADSVASTTIDVGDPNAPRM